MAGRRRSSQQKRAPSRSTRPDPYDPTLVPLVLHVLWDRTESERVKVAGKIGVTVEVVREWEADYLSNLTPLSTFSPSQRDAVADVRLVRHLEEALNAAVEGSRWGEPDARAKRADAAGVVQALMGGLRSDGAESLRVLADLRRAAVSSIDGTLREPLVVPGDHRGVTLRVNQWSSQKNELLDVIQDALDKHPREVERGDRGQLREKQLAEICAAPHAYLDKLRRTADPKILDVAREVAVDIKVGLLVHETAVDGLGEITSREMTTLEALIAHAVERGLATAPQIGRAIAYLLGVRSLKNFFDARAVRVWEAQRVARLRRG